ncbi:hypothetical protein D0C36_14210 [Mucilaginibacter conchicola]|uniref:Uncharacterized protein n=1 Tax=Mucilaginibacter conchicola TaxID=2303333 RepID=A0A372NTG1_9SPHI|nr:hypothetical protein [Mucilaginibacter conchicola]RFZ92570.1 hypothetical protein D0C36_14210 [Mucilaginibacter conchicola]
MQQSFNIDLPLGFNTPEHPDDILCFIEALFNPDSRAYPALESALQYENKPKFGPSAISHVQFVVERFDVASLKGRLRISYDMQLTFGCEDFTKDHRNQHSYYNFNIDISANHIRFSTDIIEERSTADEF